MPTLGVVPFIDESSGLEVIALAECVALLESTEIGRIAVSTAAGPRIYPINYHWDGEAIVFRVAPDSTVASSEGSSCAFEVDGSDLRRRRGWSVIALGEPTVVDPDENPETVKRLERLALYPWVPGTKDRWLRLIPAPLTGRRTVHPNGDGA
jgi:nitroimidazol reductase NimA-like FMN-containing flavoprotein (pyridoxamine 5'-phosphate oxidase superfamily)